MVTAGTIDSLPIEKLKNMLATDDLSIEILEELVASTKDPERVKLLLLALERAKHKEEKRLRDLVRAVEDAQARIQRANEILRRLSEEEAQEWSPPRP